MLESNLMVELSKELKLVKILGLEVIPRVMFTPRTISTPDWSKARLRSKSLIKRFLHLGNYIIYGISAPFNQYFCLKFFHFLLKNDSILRITCASSKECSDKKKNRLNTTGYMEIYPLQHVFYCKFCSLFNSVYTVAKPTPLELRRSFKANVAAVGTSNKYLGCPGVGLMLT